MEVVVLGAGYAGLALVRDLEDRLAEDVTITLVDEGDSHLVQHLVHRVIRRPGLADELRVPLSAVLGRADHRQARVQAVDPDAGTVELDDGELDYDLGAVCLGAQTDFGGLPGAAEHGTPLKRLPHAERIRADARDLCAAGGGHIVVGGAGLSGIQAAGELAALADEERVADAVTVTLIEQADRVAPRFPQRFQRAVADELRERGVAVETGREIDRVTADRVALADGSELAYDQLVWTGGIAGSDAMDGERPTVRARLRLGERTLGLGDAVRVVDADGTSVPASAQTAIAQADVAATNIERLLGHRRAGGGGFEPRLSTYRYDPAGWLVTVGDGAVATVGPTVVTGRAARVVKAGVGARYFRSLGVPPDVRARLGEALRGRG